MQLSSRDDLDTTLLPYKELRSVLAVYFRPNILQHQTWPEITDEIASYYTTRCMDRIVRQIEALLTNPAIDDARLTVWVQRSATSWTPHANTDARTQLQNLQVQLREASRLRKRAVALTSFTRSFA